eukprot:354728-Chlamydomonas_euryale.AAC.10
MGRRAWHRPTQRARAALATGARRRAPCPAPSAVAAGGLGDGPAAGSVELPLWSSWSFEHAHQDVLSDRSLQVPTPLQIRPQEHILLTRSTRMPSAKQVTWPSSLASQCLPAQYPRPNPLNTSMTARPTGLPRT